MKSGGGDCCCHDGDGDDDVHGDCLTGAVVSVKLRESWRETYWDCYHLGSCGGGHDGGAVTITAAAGVGGDVDDVIASVGARVGGRVVGS